MSNLSNCACQDPNNNKLKKKQLQAILTNPELESQIQFKPKSDVVSRNCQQLLAAQEVVDIKSMENVKTQKRNNFLPNEPKVNGTEKKIFKTKNSSTSKKSKLGEVSK